MELIVQLAHNYKQLSAQIEQLTKQKEAIKEQFLALINNQEGTYNDIVVSLVKPEPTFDWKTFLQKEQINPRIAERYYKPKAEHLRVTIKRSIAL